MSKKNTRYAIKSGEFYICVTYSLPDGTPQYYATTDPQECVFHKRSYASRVLDNLKLKNAEVVELLAEGKPVCN